MTATAAQASESVRESPARLGVRDATPFAIAIVPFAFAIGAASSDADLSFPVATFGLLALLAGAAHLAAIETFDTGGGLGSIVLVVVLINLRYVLYGGGVASWFGELPARRRLLLAYPVIDQTFLLCQKRFSAVIDVSDRQRYYLAATGVLASVYVVSHSIAHVAGSVLPSGLGLHLAAPLAFAGMLATAVKTAPAVAAATTAALSLVAGAGVLGVAALPIAVIAGVFAGVRATSSVDSAAVRS